MLLEFVLTGLLFGFAFSVLDIPKEYLKCTHNDIQVRFPKSLTKGYNANELYIGGDPTTCQMNEDGDYYKVVVPFQDCGTQVTALGELIYVKHKLKGKKVDNVITRRESVDIDLTCTFDKRYQTTAFGTIVQPVPLDQISLVENSEQEFDIMLKIVDKNMNAVESLTSIPVGEIAYATVTVKDEIRRLGLTPNPSSCYVAPTKEPDSKNKGLHVYLINDNCVVDETTKMETIENGKMFSFEVFAYVHNQALDLTLHCTSEICEDQDTDCNKYSQYGTCSNDPK